MDEKGMRQQLRPDWSAHQVEPEMVHVEQGEKKQCRQIGGTNPEDAPDKKTAPLLSLLVKTQVDAKSADHKKHRHTDVENADGKKTPERIGNRETTKPTGPWQDVVTVNRAQRMKQQDRQDGHTAQVIQQFKMFGGVFHSAAPRTRSSVGRRLKILNECSLKSPPNAEGDNENSNRAPMA